MSASRLATKMCIRGTWLESTNVGDNAIVVGLKDYFGDDVEITAITGAPKRVEASLGIGAVKAFNRKKLRDLFSAFRVIKKQDAFCLTGGTPFYNNSKHMLLNLMLIIWARLFGAKVYVVGVSYRPIKQFWARFAVNRILGMCQVVWFREFQSIEFVKSFCSPSIARKIRFLPDPATQININRIAEGVVDRVGAKDYVAICPRDFMSDAEFSNQHFNLDFSSSDNNSYIGSLVSYVNWIVKEKGLNVVFFPMHIFAPDDDRVIGHKVIELIDDPEVLKCITVVEDQFTPDEAVKFFLGARLLVGVRFHSVVIASTAGIPVISIGYDKKNSAIAKVLQIEEYTTNLHDFDFEMLVSMSDEIFADEQAARVKQRAVNGELRALFKEEIGARFCVPSGGGM